MSSFDIPEQGFNSPTITDLLLQRRRLQQSLSRIHSRHKLLSVAQDLLKAIQESEANHTHDPFVGELEQFNICKHVEVKFDCEKEAFDCTNEFDCDSAAGIKAYDCHDFNCGDPGGGNGSFDCNATIDFLCAGPDFDCSDTFECSAGHLFLCSDDHDCTDVFTCKATGNDPDEGTKCPENYSIPGGDGSPGDFLCGSGWEKGDDSFDCLKEFTCDAKSDFNCLATTSFKCGDESGDKFSCSADERFDCVGAFECFRYGGEYGCAAGTGGYSSPPGGGDGG